MSTYVAEPEDDLAVAVVFEEPVAVAEWLDVEEGIAVFLLAFMPSSRDVW